MLPLFSFLLLSLALTAQDKPWQTLYEESDGRKTPRYDETIKYCQRLADASPLLQYTSFGKSARGRDLPLLILDKDGLTDPKSIHETGRIILLLQACIHPGESDGKDAGLMLLRDIITGKDSVHPASDKERSLRELLNHITLLFIPIFNTDGHERFGPYNRINQNGPDEMGWRVTANNLNLNRDFLKADAPEMQAWLRMFNRWLPDFFIDTHTTDGADYQYVLTYLMEIYGDMDTGLTTWAEGTFIPSMEREMTASGFPVFPYVDFRKWHDPRSGLITEVAPPMLSQGYSSLRNRPGLLIETHMLKPYKQRVEGTYECIITTMKLLKQERQTLQNLIRKADQLVSSEAFLKMPFPLQFETSASDSIMVDFLGMKYDAVHSDLSGGLWFRYSDTPTVFKLPHFRSTRPTVTARLPYAYIVPAEWTTVIERIGMHGIQYALLKKDTTITIATFRFKNPKWQQFPFEGRHPMTSIDYDEIIEARWFPAGSAIVETMQPAGRIIPHILEPRGDGSYLYWGFFDATFEQKEYGESYVVEEMARKMMDENPELKKEFDAKKETDTLFAKSPQQILNWFYNKSPYSDNRKAIYPVGRLMDKSVVKALTRE
jgi:murein tripeptide amidase MpaA